MRLVIIAALILFGGTVLMKLFRSVTRIAAQFVPPVVFGVVVLYVLVAPMPAGDYPETVRWAYPLVQQFRNAVDLGLQWATGASGAEAAQP